MLFLIGNRLSQPCRCVNSTATLITLKDIATLTRPNSIGGEFRLSKHHQAIQP